MNTIFKWESHYSNNKFVTISNKYGRKLFTQTYSDGCLAAYTYCAFSEKEKADGLRFEYRPSGQLYYLSLWDNESSVYSDYDYICKSGFINVKSALSECANRNMQFAQFWLQNYKKYDLFDQKSLTDIADKFIEFKYSQKENTDVKI
jgi:hypothetical protein